MNFLVFLDAQAGELEKILSGVKTMLLKEIDPAPSTVPPVSPGDSLYFLRGNEDCAVRVKATVVRVLYFTSNSNEDLSCLLKEMQPRLQLTEDQYNHWCVRKQTLLVEFEAAQKTDVIQVAWCKIADRSDWIAFEDFSLLTQEEVFYENPNFKLRCKKGISHV